MLSKLTYILSILGTEGCEMATYASQGEGDQWFYSPARRISRYHRLAALLFSLSFLPFLPKRSSYIRLLEIMPSGNPQKTTAGLATFCNHRHDQYRDSQIRRHPPRLATPAEVRTTTTSSPSPPCLSSGSQSNDESSLVAPLITPLLRLLLVVIVVVVV